jgi:hypothetical protein
MPQFRRIHKIFTKVLMKIKKNHRRINKNAQPILEKSVYDSKLMQDSIFVKYFDPIILYLELNEHERESY